jgi:hypothetical protein
MFFLIPENERKRKEEINSAKPDKSISLGRLEVFLFFGLLK